MRQALDGHLLGAMWRERALWVGAAAATFVLLRVAYLQAQIWYLQRTHKRWLATVLDSDEAPHLKSEDIPRFRRVLLEARVGVENVSWPITEPTGYGFVAHRRAKLINNLCVRDDEIVRLANQKIGQAIGAYKMRRNDTLNPIRWVVAIWNLPRVLAISLGADSESKAVKASQLLYQFLVLVGLLLKAYLQLLER